MSDWFEKNQEELSRRRKSYIPTFTRRVNRLFQHATDKDLPTYIMSLHKDARSAYKRSEIQTELKHILNGEATIDQIKNVSHYLFS